MESGTAYYRTDFGAAHLGDSLAFMNAMPTESVDLVVTSPPFALKRKKEYGNVGHKEYVEWLQPFAEQIHRILKADGSFVLDLGGTWNPGFPTRSLYHYEVAIRLTQDLFHLAQEFYWYNPAKLPSPAEWVTVRRIRVKDAVNTVWWFSKTPYPNADNRRVLTPYSNSMKQLLKNGYRPKRRPSGWDITAKFLKQHAGAIPPNLLSIANTESNSEYLRRCRKSGMKPHPARFPAGLPEFFVKYLTEPEGLVLDPFAGSNVTGQVCERLGRRWIAVDMVEDYLRASRFRFDGQLMLRERPARYKKARKPRSTPKTGHRSTPQNRP
jgi:site-specific DNA-methyltransferase (cytosine-N4-specific)